jgi:hypothetical protein
MVQAGALDDRYRESAKPVVMDQGRRLPEQQKPAPALAAAGVVRSRLPLHQQRRGLVQVLLRAGDAGAPGDEGTCALTRAPLRLLGKVADGGGGRAEPGFAPDPVGPARPGCAAGWACRPRCASRAA